MKKVYISGPMSHIPDLNFPAFAIAARTLRKAGYDVTSPAEINADNGQSWKSCMRKDIKALCECDIIALLPGWEASEGAHLEIHIAHRIGILVRQIGDLLPLDFSAGFLPSPKKRDEETERSLSTIETINRFNQAGYSISERLAGELVDGATI